MTIPAPQNNKRTLKSFFPIVGWLPKYDKSWLRWDVIAALTVWGGGRRFAVINRRREHAELFAVGKDVAVVVGRRI